MFLTLREGHVKSYGEGSKNLVFTTFCFCKELDQAKLNFPNQVFNPTKRIEIELWYQIQEVKLTLKMSKITKQTNV